MSIRGRRFPEESPASQRLARLAARRERASFSKSGGTQSLIRAFIRASERSSAIGRQAKRVGTGEGRMKSLLTSVAVLGALGLTACGQDHHGYASWDGKAHAWGEEFDAYGEVRNVRRQVGEEDWRAFAFDAAYASLIEERASVLAVSRTEDDDVRRVARRAYGFHYDARARLRAALDDIETEGALPAYLEQGDFDRLATMAAATGDAFDENYLQLQEETLEAALAAYVSYAEQGEDSELRAFAAEAAPNLREQLNATRGAMAQFKISDDFEGQAVAAQPAETAVAAAAE